MKYFLLTLFLLSFSSIGVVAERQYQYKLKCETPLAKAQKSENLDSIIYHVNKSVEYMEDIGYSDDSNGIYTQDDTLDNQTKCYNQVKLAYIQLMAIPDTLTKLEQLKAARNILKPVHCNKEIKNSYASVQYFNFVVLLMLISASVFTYKMRGF